MGGSTVYEISRVKKCFAAKFAQERPGKLGKLVSGTLCQCRDPAIAPESDSGGFMVGCGGVFPGRYLSLRQETNISHTDEHV